MTNTCFLCLENTRNKVCVTCNCYAHPSCWGKYLQDQMNITTLVYPNHCAILSPLSVKCPICRERIKNIKSITRSDTKLSRKFAIYIKISQTIAMTRSIEDVNKKRKLVSELFNILIDNRSIVLENKNLSSDIQDKLSELYKNGWESANLFHLQMFGEQIKK